MEITKAAMCCAEIPKIIDSTYYFLKKEAKYTIGILKLISRKETDNTMQNLEKRRKQIEKTNNTDN